MEPTVWKAFDQNALTHSAAHYLMALHFLTQAGERGVRLSEVAGHLDVALSSCSQSLRSLVKKGLVLEDEEAKVFLLTAAGLEQVRWVEKNKEVLFSFFRDILEVEKSLADEDSCKMEHLMSLELSRKLCHFVSFLQSEHKVAQLFLEHFHTYESSLCAGGCCKQAPCPYKK